MSDDKTDLNRLYQAFLAGFEAQTAKMRTFIEDLGNDEAKDDEAKEAKTPKPRWADLFGIDPGFTGATLPEAHRKVLAECEAEAWRNVEQNDALTEADVATDIAQRLVDVYDVVTLGPLDEGVVDGVGGQAKTRRADLFGIDEWHEPPKPEISEPDNPADPERDRTKSPSINFPHSEEEAHRAVLRQIRKALFETSAVRRAVIRTDRTTDAGFGTTRSQEQTDWLNDASARLTTVLKDVLDDLEGALETPAPTLRCFAAGCKDTPKWAGVYGGELRPFCDNDRWRVPSANRWPLAKGKGTAR